MKICCESGKARIYYSIPQYGGMRFRCEGEKKFKIINADEALTNECVKAPFKGGNCDKPYKVWFAHTQTVDEVTSTSLGDFNTTGRVEYIQITFMNLINNNSLSFGKGRDSNNAYLTSFSGTGFNGGVQVFIRDYSYNEIKITRVERIDGTSEADDILQCGTQKDTIKIKGGTTGTVYLERQVNDCSKCTFQTIECKFGIEQYVDVDLAQTDFSALNYIPNFPLKNFTVLRGCILVEPYVFNKNQINIGVMLQTRIGDNWVDVPFLGTNTIKTITSPEGCPPPKVRVECCRKGICGEDKKCPPETDCELKCGEFKCCYKNGKLIKEIKL